MTRSLQGNPYSWRGMTSCYSSLERGLKSTKEKHFQWLWLGFQFRVSWACLMTETLKSLLAMRETQVQSVGWKGPLQKGIATHSCLKDSMDRGAWRVPQPMTLQEGHTLSNWHFNFCYDWVYCFHVFFLTCHIWLRQPVLIFTHCF